MGIFVQIYLCLIIIVCCDAAKILAVFPTPAYSHQKVLRRVTEELVKRGHKLVVVGSQLANQNETTNLRNIIMNDSFPLWKQEICTKYGKNKYHNTRMRRIYEVHKLILDMMLKNTEVIQLIKDEETFDLLIVEAYVRPALAFSHIFQAPVIKLNSLMAVVDEHHVVGSTTHPIFYPICYQQRIESNTIFEKVSELYTNLFIHSVYDGYENEENLLIKRNFSDFRTLSEMNNNVDMLFLNTHPIWEHNRPVPPSLIYGGALHLNPIKELPKDLETYLNASVHGVIYVSFGTNFAISSFPPAGLQAIVRVLSAQPYDVLWKWDDDELPGRGSNIKLAKWLPQADLLRHPKIKLFVTQCGMQSTDEAIAAGIPLVGIPLQGDQWYNSETYIKHKIGLKVEMETITEEEFRDAIKTVIEDESYRRNIESFRAHLHDSRQSPMERIMWWTEHVLRHGARHLRAPAHNMHWTEYLEIELLGIVILCVVVCLVVHTTCLYYLIKFTWIIINRIRNNIVKNLFAIMCVNIILK